MTMSAGALVWATSARPEATRRPSDLPRYLGNELTSLTRLKHIFAPHL